MTFGSELEKFESTLLGMSRELSTRSPGGLSCFSRVTIARFVDPSGLKNSWQIFFCIQTFFLINSQVVARNLRNELQVRIIIVEKHCQCNPREARNCPRYLSESIRTHSGKRRSGCSFFGATSVSVPKRSQTLFQSS